MSDLGGGSQTPAAVADKGRERSIGLLGSAVPLPARAERALLLLALCLALALRMWVAWQPVPVLLERNLPDDAYYYFVLAHHAVQEGTVSLDGVNTTNGFHPLWLVLLLPVFGAADTPGDLQVHLALSLGVLLDLVCLLALARATSRLAGFPAPGVIAAFVYALNPMAVLQSTNGLETSLSMALLGLFLAAFVAWLSPERPGKRALLVGVLGGAAFLARSDNAFFLAVAFAMAFFHWRKDPAKRLSVFQAGAVAALVAAPWFLWSKLVVGSWIQESGMAVPIAIRYRFELAEGQGFGAAIVESIRQMTYPNLWLRGDPTGLPLVGGGILWLWVLLRLAARWRHDQRPFEKQIMTILLGSGALLFFFHAGLRWYPRPWYFSPMAGAFAVAAGLALQSAGQRRTWNGLACVAIAIYFLASGALLWRLGLYPWQREMRLASQWISSATPVGSSVASFNAGIYAYYGGRQVVNLDGVVNHAAFDAVKDRALAAYILSAGIGYLVDYDSAVHREYAPLMGNGYPEILEPVAVLGGALDGPLGLLRAYRIQPPDG